MERKEEQRDTVIDLGAASTTTQGPPGVFLEFGIPNDQPAAIDAE